MGLWKTYFLGKAGKDYGRGAPWVVSITVVLSRVIQRMSLLYAQSSGAGSG